MPRVGGVAALAARLGAGSWDPAGEIVPAPSRDLVIINPIQPTERLRGPSQRPYAAFIAQLIATDHQAPQTCARRRATPEEALAVYTAALARPRPAAFRRAV